jgi:metal-sulfur cluster biosynthetic enzyme
MQVDEQRCMAKDFRRLQIENTVEHNAFRTALDSHFKWTHEVYLDKIIPNETRSMENEKEIIRIKGGIH